MRTLSALLTLATLTLACDKGDSTGSGEGSSSGATAATAASATTGDVPTTAGPDTSPTTSDATSDATSGNPTGDPTGNLTGDPTGTMTGDPTGDPTGNPTGDPTGNPTGDPTGDPDEAATQLCVDTINMYRATLGLPPYARWTDAEVCSDGEAAMDGDSGNPHGAFGMCGESAQNECPGWPGPPESMITGCLELMWAEGPGEDFNLHGHYINMSSTQYTQVAQGFADGMNGVWAVQNFK